LLELQCAGVRANSVPQLKVSGGNRTVGNSGSKFPHRPWWTIVSRLSGPLDNFSWPQPIKYCQADRFGGRTVLAITPVTTGFGDYTFADQVTKNDLF
jgi:hypothetical protein